jgi:hypothetical protein
MAQAVSCRPLIAVARVHLQIFGGRGGSGAGYSPSPSGFLVSILPLLHHIDLYLRVTLNRKTNRGALGIFQKQYFSAEIGEHLIKLYFQCFSL